MTLDSPDVALTRLREEAPSPDQWHPEERPVRVLLAGRACLHYGLDLPDGSINIVGYVENVAEAARVVEVLKPDAVLVELADSDDHRLLSEVVPVVIPPPEAAVIDVNGRERDEMDLRLTRIALALTTAEPARRLFCLSGSCAD